MQYFRYWLASYLIELGIRVLPDDYTKSRMALGMQWAADLINKELSIESEYDEDNYAERTRED